MKQQPYSRRINEQAREKLGYILLFELSDPALELITLTDVEVSLDKSLLRAYVNCESDRYEEVLAALGRARGRIRSLLGRALGWRVTPEIDFRIDTTLDDAERLQVALEDVPPTMGVAKDEFGYPVAADADVPDGEKVAETDSAEDD